MPLNDAPLTPDERGLLRRRLLLRSRQLRTELGEALHSGEPSGAHLANRHREVDDDAVAEAETMVDIAGVQRDEREIFDVSEALRRIDRDDFGRCANCGQSIGRPRLFAIPQARRCIGCEQRAQAPR